MGLPLNMREGHDCVEDRKSTGYGLGMMGKQIVEEEEEKEGTEDEEEGGHCSSSVAETWASVAWAYETSTNLQECCLLYVNRK